MKKIFNLSVLVFFLSFLVGVGIFFPLNKLRYPLVNAVNRATGADLQIGRIHLGTGLGLGLSKGSLVALLADNVILTLPTGASLKCESVTLTPHLLPLLLGRLNLGVGCDLRPDMSLSGRLSAAPFWSPSNVSADLDLHGLDLDAISGFLPSSGFAGILQGEVHIENLNPNLPKIPDVSWDLSGRDVLLPGLANDVFNLPPLALGPVKAEGSFRPGKLVMKELKFGSDQLPLQGQVKMDLGLDRSGQPVSGDITGKLKSDPGFEKMQLKDINMDLLFGKVKASGFREFKKTAKGNVVSLMGKPDGEP